MNFTYYKYKSITATKYIMNKIIGIDLENLYNILFLSEQAHLVKYGRPITGDTFIVYDKYPVPLNLYGIINNDIRNLNVYGFGINYLSKSDFDMLDIYIAEYKNNNIEMISNEQFIQNEEIDILLIAKLGNASENMLKIIKINMENDIEL